MNEIYDINWHEEMQKYDNVNDMCSSFISTLNKSYQSSFPSVTVSRKRKKDKPWMNSDLMCNRFQQNIAKKL